jgi:hypothetical protein
MNVTPSIVDFVSKHALKNGAWVSLIFLGNVALMVFTCLAVGFILRPRKFRNLPIVGKHEDLYGGLLEGTRKVMASILACTGE